MIGFCGQDNAENKERLVLSMNNFAVDYYKMLNVSPDASDDEIRRAYKRIAKKYHPDVNSTPAAEEVMKDANDAENTLLDPLMRRKFDEAFGYSGLRSQEGSHAGSSRSDSFDDSADGFENHATEENDKTSKNFEKNYQGFEIPEDFENVSPKLKTKVVDVMLVPVLIILALGIALLLESNAHQMNTIGLVAFVVSLIVSVFFFVSARRGKKSFPNILANIFVVCVCLVICRFIRSGVRTHVAIAKSVVDHVYFVVPIVLSYVSSSQFWWLRDRRKVLEPYKSFFNFSLIPSRRKSMVTLNDSNSISFGPVSSLPEENALDNSINKLWKISGFRRVEFRTAAFSQMWFFGNRLVVVKPVFLRRKGLVSVKRGAVVLEANSYDNDVVSSLDYVKALNKFSEDMKKHKIEIYPMVAVYPPQNMTAFDDHQNIILVRGDRVEDVAAEILLKDQSPDVPIEYDAIVDAVMAANEIAKTMKSR